MPRDYVRKTERLSWDEKHMERAVKAVLNGEYNCSKAAETFVVPRTLARKVASFQKLANDEKNAEKKITKGEFSARKIPFLAQIFEK